MRGGLRFASIACAGLAALALVHIDARPARADCAPDGVDDLGNRLPFSGGVVVCSGVDDNGFVRTSREPLEARDNLTVIVTGIVRRIAGFVIDLAGSSHEVRVTGGTLEGGARIDGADPTFSVSDGAVDGLLLGIGDRPSYTMTGGTVANVDLSGADSTTTISNGIVEIFRASGDRPTFSMTGGIIADTSGVDGIGAAVTIDDGALLNFDVEGDNSVVTVNGGDLLGEFVVRGANATLTVNGGNLSGGVGIVGDGATLTNNHEIAGGAASALGGAIINEGTILGQGNADADEAFDAVSIFDADGSLLNRGTIRTTGPGADGVAADGANTEVDNRNTISTTGAQSDAVSMDGANTRATNAAGAVILTEGDESTGISLDGMNARATNRGRISTLGDDALGMAGDGDDVALTNTNLISTAGERAIGIGIDGNSANAINSGEITTKGTQAFGIGVIGDANVIVNQAAGMIETEGARAAAIRAGLDEIDMPVDQVTITNDGQLQTRGDGAVGIEVAGNSAVINNNKDISTQGATSQGIAVRGDNTILAFNNEGATIGTTGEFASGMFVEGTGGNYANFGTIVTGGMNAHGVAVEGDGVTVTNALKGSISTLGVGAHGIAIGSEALGRAVSDNTVRNGNQIVTAGQFADGIHVVGDANTVTVDLSGEEAEGSTTVSTFGSDADGIELNGQNNTLNNAGTVTANGPGGDGVRMIGTNQMFNSGTIEAKGLNAAGVRAMTVASPSGFIDFQVITNNGTIRGAGTAIVGSELIEVVNNFDMIEGSVSLMGGNDRVGLAAGSMITGDVDLGEGNDSITMNSGIDASNANFLVGRIDGNLMLGGGDDTVTITTDDHVAGDVEGGSGTDTLAVDNALVFNGSQFSQFEKLTVDTTLLVQMEGTLSVDTAVISSATGGLFNVLTGAVLNTTLTQVVAGTTLGGNGTIRGEIVEVTQAMVNAGGSIGALTIEANLLMDDSVFEVEIAGTDAGEFDVLTVLGDVEFRGGEILLSFLDDFLPSVDDVFDFLIADAITGLETVTIAQRGLPSGFEFGFSQTSDGLRLVTQAAAVPEPSSLALFMIGGLGLIVLARRRRSRSAV